MSSALCRRPPTTIRPSIFPATKMRPAGPMNPSRPVLVKGRSLIEEPSLAKGKTCTWEWTCEQSGQQRRNDLKGWWPHLKGVLGHAAEAVIRGSRGNSANTQLADLVGFTELRNAFELYHTHHTCRKRPQLLERLELTKLYPRPKWNCLIELMSVFWTQSQVPPE